MLKLERIFLTFNPGTVNENDNHTAYYGLVTKAYIVE